MRQDLKAARLTAAHQQIATSHPYREIIWQTFAPILVPVAGVVAVLALVVFGGRTVLSRVSGIDVDLVPNSVPNLVPDGAGPAVLGGVAVLTALVLIWALVRWLRNPLRTPFGWGKYM